MVLESCPKCSHRLGPPLKSSGRQVCMKCGWSNRPRKAATPTQNPPQKDLSPIEIQKILAQATEKSMHNMKPRHKRNSGEGGDPPQDDGPSIDDLLNPRSK